MFDDKQNPQAPSNLPTGNEPDDMFAGIEDGNSPAPAQAVEQAPNALDAGLLKPKTSEQEMATPAVTPEQPQPTPIPQSIQTPPIDPSGSGDMSEQQPSNQPVYAIKEPILGKILLVVFLFFILVGLGFGGFWFFDKYVLNEADDTGFLVEDLDNTESLFPPQEQLIDTAEPVVEEPITEEPIIEDEVENIIGDMNNDTILFGEPVDSDKDGLDDIREEELGTDPNNSDTDSDGLDDASEVLIWKTNPNNPDTDGDGYSDGVEIKAGYNPLGPGKIFETEPEVATTTDETATTTDTSTTTE